MLFATPSKLSVRRRFSQQQVELMQINKRETDSAYYVLSLRRGGTKDSLPD